MSIRAKAIIFILIGVVIFCAFVIYINYVSFDSKFSLLFCEIPVTNKTEFIEAFVQFLGWVATAGAAFIAGCSLRETSLDKKRQNAFSMISAWNDLQLTQNRMDVQKKVEHQDDVYFVITSSSDLDAKVKQILGILEDMALAVNQKNADKNIITLSMTPGFIHFYNLLFPYIEKSREKDGHMDYYIEFERFTKNLVNRAKLRDHITELEKKEDQCKILKFCLVLCYKAYFKWEYDR